jgi:hypothetical protein
MREEGSNAMRRTLIVSFVAAAALSVTAASATAAPTNATNYEAIPATCEALGEIVIEVTNIGHWGTGKVQGTGLTLIPRSFVFTGTNLDTNEVVFEDSFAKRNDAVDDTCTFTFIEEVPEGDEFLEPGTYEIRGTVGVKVVGP